MDDLSSLRFTTLQVEEIRKAYNVHIAAVEHPNTLPEEERREYWMYSFLLYDILVRGPGTFTQVEVLETNRSIFERILRLDPTLGNQARDEQLQRLFASAWERLAKFRVLDDPPH